jgi:hypothetical protein
MTCGKDRPTRFPISYVNFGAIAARGLPLSTAVRGIACRARESEDGGLNSVDPLILPALYPSRNGTSIKLCRTIKASSAGDMCLM